MSFLCRSRCHKDGQDDEGSLPHFEEKFNYRCPMSIFLTAACQSSMADNLITKEITWVCHSPCPLMIKEIAFGL